MDFPKVEQVGNKKRIYYKSQIVEYVPQKSYDGSEISLDALHPKFKPLATQLLVTLKNKLPKYRIQVNCTFRTKEEQEELRKKNPKTAAKISPHCFGLAIDISIVDQNGKAVTSQPEIQKKLEEAAEEVGIYWGGWFSSVKEPWHFQIALNWEA